MFWHEKLRRNNAICSPRHSETKEIPCLLVRLPAKSLTYQSKNNVHDDVIKWKHFPRYWLFLRGIHRWPVNSPHKGQWRRSLVFSLICAWINSWVNNRETGDLRGHRAHYDVTVMSEYFPQEQSMEWYINFIYFIRNRYSPPANYVILQKFSPTVYCCFW